MMCLGGWYEKFQEKVASTITLSIIFLFYPYQVSAESGLGNHLISGTISGSGGNPFSGTKVIPRVEHDVNGRVFCTVGI
jgi:hypothetical protein